MGTEDVKNKPDSSQLVAPELPVEVNLGRKEERVIPTPRASVRVLDGGARSRESNF